MGETYEKTFCPHCKTKNIVCLGNMDDCTAPDVEGVVCRQCKEAYLLGDDEWSRRESLYCIAVSHLEFNDEEEGQYDRELQEFLDTFFVDDGTPELKPTERRWKGQTLSEVLKEHAYLENGKESI